MNITQPGPFLTDPSGQEHPLESQTMTIGRAVECDIVIVSKSISREHARLHCDGRRWYVKDVGSTNGTFRNNERVVTSLDLRDGDSLKVGEVTFIFHDPDTTSRENPVPDLEVGLIGSFRPGHPAARGAPALACHLHSRGCLDPCAGDMPSIRFLYSTH